MSTIVEILIIWIVVGFFLGLIVGRFIDRNGRRAIFFALALAGSASSVSAQPINWSAYTVMAAGNVADLWTTQSALSSGRAHEGNPALSRQGIGTITVAKTCGVAVIGVAMRLLETHGHAKAARILGWMDGGVTFTAALHNQRVGR